MLAWTVEAFQQAKAIDGIILVVAREQMGLARRLRYSKIIKVVPGGKERQDSVKNGLKALPASAEIVAIHDGARPAVTVDLIEKSVLAAKKHGAAVVGVPVKDTVKQVGTMHYAVIRTLDRDQLWHAQTPQTFKVSLIKKAYSKLKGRVTDDAMAVEKLGKPVKMVMGSYENLKVTAPEDLKIVEAILKERRK
jgi:2-C-methyl-D-erythritol 4-phosphate cytidylyltransferase